jgi:hypothetical protein
MATDAPEETQGGITTGLLSLAKGSALTLAWDNSFRASGLVRRFCAVYKTWPVVASQKVASHKTFVSLSSLSLIGYLIGLYAIQERL